MNFGSRGAITILNLVAGLRLSDKVISTEEFPSQEFLLHQPDFKTDLSIH